MALLGLTLLFSPDETKTIGIVAVTVFSFVGALLYPIARAYARRLEGGGATAALRDELADVSARLDGLQQSEGRMAELEARLDFAERVLTRQRDAESLRLPGS